MRNFVVPPSGLSVASSPTGFVVYVEGRGGARESLALQTFASSCASSRDALGITVDLNGCQHLDSTFLGCLVGIVKLFRREPARFVVAADDDARKRLLAATHLDRVLPLCEESAGVLSERLCLTPSHLETRDLGRHILVCHQQLAELGGPHSAAFRSVADQLSRELDQTDK